MGHQNHEFDEIKMDTLIDQFVQLTLERKKWEHNPRKANNAYLKRHEVFKELRKKNELSKLRPLLDSKDVDVKGAASAYYLLVDEDLAKKKLREISKLGGIYSLTAELIKQWDNGEVDFDY